ncbi:MAG: DUF4296 domain-containing protein [Bacteroidota bacterium]
MRQFHLIGLFLLFLVLMGCQKDPPPPLHIAEETLIDVLFDIYVAEAAIQPVIEGQKDSVANLYYEQIFTIHEINRDAFFKDVAILREYPELTKELYNKVIDRLKEVEKEGKGKDTKK